MSVRRGKSEPSATPSDSGNAGSGSPASPPCPRAVSLEPGGRVVVPPGSTAPGMATASNGVDRPDLFETGSRDPSSCDLPDECGSILTEISQIEAELRPRRSASDASSPSEERDGMPETVRPRSGGEHADTQGEGVTPYLEERLRIAGASMVVLGRELRNLEQRWGGLRQSAEVLEQELASAVREVDFLRSSARIGPEATAVPPPSSRASPTDRATATPPTPSRPEPYGAFTAARYHRTVGGLKGRRRALAWWTVLLAATISAILIILALLAGESTPPVWIAVLPAVWLIPVPFFVVSFLATHRVLRRNRLDLPGDL